MALPKVWEKITELTKKISGIVLKNTTDVDGNVITSTNFVDNNKELVVRDGVNTSCILFRNNSTYRGVYLRAAPPEATGSADGWNKGGLLVLRDLGSTRDSGGFLLRAQPTESSGKGEHDLFCATDENKGYLSWTGDAGLWFTKTEFSISQKTGTSGESSCVDIGYYDSATRGASIALRKTWDNEDGYVFINAETPSSRTRFIVQPNGIIRYSGAYLRAEDTSFLFVGFNNSTRTGGYTVFRSKDYTALPGATQIIADNGSTNCVYNFTTSGVPTAGGKDFEIVSSSSVVSNWGYIRYTSGLQICWGRVYSNGTISSTNKVVTFPQAFKEVPTVFGGSNANNGNHIVLVGWETSTNFTIGSSGTGLVTWYAIGAWK